MTPRRALLLAAGAGLAGRATAQGNAATDLMPDFWRAYDDAGHGSFEERGRAIIASYFAPHAATYRDAGVGRVDLARWLQAFDPMAPAARRLSEGFPRIWETHAARFAASLPDFDVATPVTILVSFLQFDARVRLVGDRVALFVGVDGALRFGAELSVLLAHECFHLYHHQVNATLLLPGGDPLWLGVWKEGLAVHASGVLDPAAAPRAVLLGEAALAAADAALVRNAAAAIQPLLDETAGAARDRFLSYGAGGTLSSRSGYLLGLLIVRRVAAGRDLAALARVPAAEARALVHQTIVSLAAGG